MEEEIRYLRELTKPLLREEWDFAYKLDKRTAKAINGLIHRLVTIQEISISESKGEIAPEKAIEDIRKVMKNESIL